jgi:hypothetical protein
MIKTTTTAITANIVRVKESIRLLSGTVLHSAMCQATFSMP